MASAKLTDLPPELLDHITTYLPTASSLAALSTVSKSLNAFVEKDAWQTFVGRRFPSISPPNSECHRDVARTLTTLSKAYDRRAFQVRCLEPTGDVIAFPGAKRIEHWKRPHGQTIGFTPKLDVVEHIASSWQDRTEVLAFSAGTELCIREKKRVHGSEGVRWLTYRPLTAFEGKDDITTLHLFSQKENEQYHVITGTANGDLQLLQLPPNGNSSVPISYFTTQGLPVRSSSVLRTGNCNDMLVASMGDSRLAVYMIDPSTSKSAPVSQVDTRSAITDDGSPSSSRAWTTKALSSSTIAVGLGPSEKPIHLHHLGPAGLTEDPIRRLSLPYDIDSVLESLPGDKHKRGAISSVYSIEPVPSASTSRSTGEVFLSGAFDGLIRLHDLRSGRDVEQSYVDPIDDSAIYSLLPRGQESVIAGSSRQSRLKFFDLRMAGKCYSYLDGSSDRSTPHARYRASRNWSLFMRRTGGANWGPSRRQHWQPSRPTESAIYSLASSSHHSPFVYAGLENAIMEMAFTAVLDQHPDTTFFDPWRPSKNGQTKRTDAWSNSDFLDLAMVDQTPDMKLHTQKSLWETWRSHQSPLAHTVEFPRTECLDERWKVGT